MCFFVSRPVLKYDHDGVFRKRYKSEQEACKKLNIDPGNLCRALHKSIRAGGFYWKYDNGEKLKIKICISERSGKKIKVFKNALYICECCSIKCAAELTKIKTVLISHHLNGSKIPNFEFKFVESK